MSTAEIRTEIDGFLSQINDDSFLKVVHSMLGTYVHEHSDEIIGYEVSGEPVLASVARAQFDEDLKNRDEFMSVEDFEKELENL